MAKTISALTILGSPHDKRSNTRGFVEDFISDLRKRDVLIENRTISLGSINIKPCKGCWNCTKEKPCPVGDDDLEMVKEAMLDCDMLILASPVYTNQVSAQMKMFFDRLFTWVHVFPLLGKFGMTAVTTSNDGWKETGDYLEKIMATLGISSFGTIAGRGAFAPGFFPRRDSERMKNSKMADKASALLRNGKLPAPTRWNKRMYAVMKKKLVGINLVRHMSGSQPSGSPAPSGILLRMMRKEMKKKGIEQKDVDKLSGFMNFEYSWWIDRSWYGTRSFSQLAGTSVPESFDLKRRLLNR
jgi:multimeric flavodoxin WrbA